jgi:hypothetical protein
MATGDQRRGPKDDGPGQPPLEELLHADEGPMRRDLLRQIAALEKTLSDFLIEHAPYEQLRAASDRGPSLLDAAELEQVRDDLLANIAEAKERVAQRFAAQLDDGDEEPEAGRARRLLWRLRGRKHRRST